MKTAIRSALVAPIRNLAALAFLLALSAAFTLPAPKAALAGDVSLGVGVTATASEYKRMDPVYFPYPLIRYEGDRFYVRGLTAGVHVWKEGMNELSLNVSYNPFSFDASKSDSWSMRQLDDRHSSVMAGVLYRLLTPYGTARAGISGDVLGNSNGLLGDLGYQYPFTFNKFTLTPGIGVFWASENYNDYYYGVSGKESRKSGMEKYDADAGFSPYAELGANYALFEHWNLFATGRVKFVSDEVKESPMVDKDTATTLTIGVRYDF